MNIVDREAIEDLFRRLRDVEAKSGQRDPDAEALIARFVERQPAAAYYLAQTVLVQQWALTAAHDRIENLESRAGGFLSAIFGSRDGARAREPDPRQSARPPEGVGFLAGASQTALGVAGGFILADMLIDAKFTDQAFAAGMAPSPPDAGAAGDFGGGDLGGGDFGGGGE